MGFISFIKTKNKLKKCMGGVVPQIIMFSEGNSYRYTNMPVLEELIKSVKVIYITIDKNDDLLKKEMTNILPIFIKLDFFGLLFLQTLKAKLFITTTPGLDVLALKRSQNVSHYSCFMHSPLDVGGYQKNSFNNFDSICCVGDFQIDSLNRQEAKRNTKVKEKVALGVPYYDIFMKEYKSKHNNFDTKNINTILVAPSWGGKNFLKLIDYDIFQVLLDSGYKVIFRPHPQSFVAEADLLKKIEKHNNNPNFEFDKNYSIIPSFEKSDLIISSFSGVIFDFAYITGQPSIIFDFTRDESFYDSIDLDRPSWEKDEVKKIGKVLEVNQKIDILDIIKNLDIDKYKNNIEASKKQIANLGNCSKKIVDFYLRKIETL